MWKIAHLSVLGFGISAFVTGIFILANPETTIALLNLHLGSVPSIRGNGLAASAMGVYYTLAAYQNNKTFFKLSAFMRIVSAYVFWKQNWIVPALWEGSFAAATALSLFFDL